MATETFRLNGGQATVTVEGVSASWVKITINGQEVELGTGAGPAAGTGSEAEGTSRVRLTTAADGVDNNVRVLLVATGGAWAPGPRAKASVRVSSTSRVEHHRGRRDDPHAPPDSSADHSWKP